MHYYTIPKDLSGGSRMGNPMNPTNEEIRLDLCEAIETLNSLIDGESDELGQ